MLVAGAVGVPVFFILLLTIGTSQDTFNDLGSILEQVASYQLIGALSPSQLLALQMLEHVGVLDAAFGTFVHLVIHMPSSEMLAQFYAVYFGGLSQMFFNPSQEITFLDHIVGTVCVFLFPFLIYFCIFSFMVSTLPPALRHMVSALSSC
jgi:hypothetical protein